MHFPIKGDAAALTAVKEKGVIAFMTLISKILQKRRS
jgi:hypothetical protein